MIELNNLSSALCVMGFKEESKGIQTKRYDDFDCSISVDFNEKRIIYPTDKGLVVNDTTTSNFDKNENFVVLECVDRLLSKGYRPNHIELEKGWKLGHEIKGGKSDVFVYDYDKNNVLLIIECKTYGDKYKEELKNTKTDGGQLFSYWQQERSTKWLCLYASDFVNGSIIYEHEIISCSDDANLLSLSKKDESLKLFNTANTVAEKYSAWTETYSQKTFQGLIFGEDAIAYKIGIKPIRKKDLKDFSPQDKIVNKFEEILRHNNVSDKENAFNRLVALFICKLVDEIRKNDEDEVEFQYKQGTDTYESLQDRLQRLHQEGMRDFMGEEIFYVPADYPEWLFQNYTGQRREKAIEDLRNTIRILKYYSNNDFAFKDVHNEELFLQNGKILVEVVQLFQRYRIVYSSKKQFLGNLFETLLSNGFRQDEGQFFTPIPITRFIWDSLPLSEIVKNNNINKYPRVVDYACGAGHFLTEAVEAINYTLAGNESQTNGWTRDSIFGIEKDYRLARVAKISLFMNGAGEGNIIFGDGLESDKSKGITNGSFDILVANPPYSVAGFKSHLKLKNNSLSLLSRISDNSSEIESLFVERTAQLLKPKGIAAIILPSTILTNDTSYTGAREILLQNFHIRGVVQLGEKTFGATPTSTVILFLEKYNEPPKKLDLIVDSVDAIIEKRNLSEWSDSDILSGYLRHIGISSQDYYRFLSGECISLGEGVPEYVERYIESFNNSTGINRWRASKSYSILSNEDREKEERNRFVRFASAIEKEKLKYFGLTFGDKTTIISCPADNKKKQIFLGFKWTKRDKSLKLETIRPGGLLYVADDRENPNTLAAAIRNSFLNEPWEGTEANAEYVKVVNTEGLIDFSGVKFIKDLRTTAEIRVNFISKYPLVPLGKIIVKPIGGLWTGKNGQLVSAKVLRGTNFTNDGRLNDEDIAVIKVEKKSFEKRTLKKGDIVIEKSGGSANQAVGRVIFFDRDDPDYSFSNFTNRLRIKNDDVLPKYLYIVLNRIYMDGYTFGYQTGASNIKNLKMEKYLGIKIPVPPRNVQEQLVEKIAAIDNEYEIKRLTIEEYRGMIDKAFIDTEVGRMSGV